MLTQLLVGEPDWRVGHRDRFDVWIDIDIYKFAVLAAGQGHIENSEPVFCSVVAHGVFIGKDETVVKFHPLYLVNSGQDDVVVWN